MSKSTTDIFSKFHALLGREAVAEPGLGLEPFLHLDEGGIYNPQTGRSLNPESASFRQVRLLHSSELRPQDLSASARESLRAEGWLVTIEGAESGRRFRLKYASIEAGTVCNQSCYFCPVSTDPREAHTMPFELYEQIVRQLAAYKDTLEGVSMIQYNEPTVDTLFIPRLRLLKQYGLKPAFSTNGTGLTPERTDDIVAAGGIRFLAINLSTLDPQRYAADRGHDHLAVVLRNVDYAATRRAAVQMEIMVLGRGDEYHKADFRAIQERYAGSMFEVKSAVVMDRAGAVTVGIKPYTPVRKLCGCEQTGSRPLEWIHILPDAQCVLCCQDYHAKYVIGDLKRQTLDEVLAGPEIARLRRWAYGLEDAPGDFICRHCVYARGQ